MSAWAVWTARDSDGPVCGGEIMVFFFSCLGPTVTQSGTVTGPVELVYSNRDVTADCVTEVKLQTQLSDLAALGWGPQNSRQRTEPSVKFITRFPIPVKASSFSPNNIWWMDAWMDGRIQN